MKAVAREPTPVLDILYSYLAVAQPSMCWQHLYSSHFFIPKRISVIKIYCNYHQGLLSGRATGGEAYLCPSSGEGQGLGDTHQGDPQGGGHLEGSDWGTGLRRCRTSRGDTPPGWPHPLDESPGGVHHQPAGPHCQGRCAHALSREETHWAGQEMRQREQLNALFFFYGLRMILLFKSKVVAKSNN